MDSASHDHSYLSILGKVPSGIYILSAKHGDDVTGMLASWVMQAGFDSPMVTVSEEGKKLLGHFGRGFEPGVPAFENLSCSHHETGVVLLEEGVIGHFVCIPKAYVESGDHLIVVAEVIDGKSLNETRPMVHVRKRGDTY